MNREEFYNNLYLAHHGIEGQKWGKRNGPPYPLDNGDYSSAERRAMAKEERQEKRRVKEYGGAERISERKEELKITSDQSISQQQRDWANARRNANQSIKEAARNRNISLGLGAGIASAAAIGATAVNPLIGMLGVYSIPMLANAAITEYGRNVLKRQEMVAIMETRLINEEMMTRHNNSRK